MKEEPVDDPSVAPPPARFTDGTRSLTLEDIKGQLLQVADKMVSTLADVILDNASHENNGQLVTQLSCSSLNLKCTRHSLSELLCRMSMYVLLGVRSPNAPLG